MSDAALRAAERAWRAVPDDGALADAALMAFERARRDPLWELIAAAPRWRPVVGFVVWDGRFEAAEADPGTAAEADGSFRPPNARAQQAGW